MGVTTEEAIDRWGDAVLRLALSRTGNRADAEDVFQTVFLRFHQANQAGKRFESDEHTKAWLLRVTLNCCNDLHRSRWRRNRVAFDEGLASGLVDEGYGSGHPQNGASPLFDELAQAVADLSEKQRVVVHLFYGEGYSTEEIAHITGERPTTVRSHLHRARKTLKIDLGAQS